MGLFNFLSKKSEEIIVDAETVEEDSFIETAEKTALIVTENVDKKKITEVSDKLTECFGKYTGRENFVFDPMPNYVWILLFSISMICSLSFLWFLPVAAGTLLYSATYKMYGIYIILVVVAIIFVNGYLCWKSLRELRFSKRYMQYRSVLQYKNFEFTDDLASIIDFKREVVERDLKKAVKEKLIPQGNFGEDNLVFMVTAEAFAKYYASKPAYDLYFRQLWENRSKVEVRTKEAEELLVQGEEYIGKIQDRNAIIKSKEISDKLKKVENIAVTVFHEINVKPADIDKLGIFINYYLPAIEKLLKSYIEIGEEQVKGDSLQKDQRDIIQALDSINNAFESLLVRFYEERELDVANEISELEATMKQEAILTD